MDDSSDIVMLIFFLVMFLALALVGFGSSASSASNKSPFIKRSLLTEDELQFYIKLKLLAEEYGFQVIIKIKMSDLLELKSELSDEKKKDLTSKIEAENVDFVLVKDMNVRLLVDFSDSTEETFKKTALESAGYVYFRTLESTENIEKFLSEHFSAIS